METEELNLDEAVAALGLTYSAMFIPQKFSRNATSDFKFINWKITLSKDYDFLTVDYTQGIGHIPTTSKWNKHLGRTNEVMASSMGKYRKTENGMDLPLPKPELKDVLYSLTIDSDVRDYCSFEDWADEYGYSSDSISSKKMYEECKAVAKTFSKMVDLNKLEILFQDY